MKDKAIQRIFLGLGSNMGDRVAYLLQARQLLSDSGVTVVRASSLYQTAPWGVQDQPDFLNQVLEVSSDLGPMDLLETVMGIEKQLGRLRVEHWGPRTVDIDLLAMGQLELRSQRLTVPHPYLQARAFVLKPWAEIASDFVVPGLNATVRQLLEALPEAEVAGVNAVPAGKQGHPGSSGIADQAE